MKKVVLIAFVLCTILATPAFFAAAAEETTLSGEPVDISCYLSGKEGEGHAACATACANKGQPIGLKVTDGDTTELYLVIGGHGKAAKDLMASHMGKQVKVTGEVSDKEGMKVITVSAVEG